LGPYYLDIPGLFPLKFHPHRLKEGLHFVTAFFIKLDYRIVLFNPGNTEGKKGRKERIVLIKHIYIIKLAGLSLLVESPMQNSRRNNGDRAFTHRIGGTAIKEGARTRSHVQEFPGTMKMSFRVGGSPGLSNKSKITNFVLYPNIRGKHNNEQYLNIFFIIRQ